MWKANLNRHFTKMKPALKISAFLVIWSALFHSFMLSILLYWSLTSEQVSALGRMTTLNQFLSENQILFAAASSLSAIFFFRDRIAEVWAERKIAPLNLIKASLRGIGFGSVMIGALILNHEYEFLGFSTQLGLNFLASYAWILRALLIIVFVFSTEFLAKVVILRETQDRLSRILLPDLTLLFMYWVWFNPKGGEIATLLLLFSLFSTFWSSSGFISAFFILVHAVFGLNFFENESIGILQLKVNQSEETFFQNHTLQAMLVILLILLQYVRLKLRKDSTPS